MHLNRLQILKKSSTDKIVFNLANIQFRISKSAKLVSFQKVKEVPISK